MQRFPYAHATHPQWQMAVALVLAQLRAHLQLTPRARCPGLALLYLTDLYAPYAQPILDLLSAELPEVTDWAGATGVGIAVNNAEYFDEPALAVMLCDLPSDQYRVFSGVAPLGQGAAFEAHTALVHADGETTDLPELLLELAQRTATGYLFGGLASARGDAVQIATGGNGNMRGQGLASGVFQGGLSGVAFGPGVSLLSRVTQGCQPVAGSSTRRVTAADGNLVLSLDGEPALDCLLRDLGVTLTQPRTALAAVRATLVGLSDASSDSPRQRGRLGSDTRVRHIIGLDPNRGGVAVADQVLPGEYLAFCQRNAEAARADLLRVCAEIREELESCEPQTAAVLPGADPADPAAPPRILGAIYVSCAGRGGPHFGAPSAELQLVRRALGDVPLVGFFAGGEIARHALYGYTGVITVFTDLQTR